MVHQRNRVDADLMFEADYVLEKLQRYVKGSKTFKITRAEPYWLHQRCAAQARKGRVLLASDALHVSSRGCKTTLAC